MCNEKFKSDNDYYTFACNELIYTIAGKDIGFYNATCYQSQQVVEKFLKHIIDCYILKDKDSIEILKTHNLKKLYKYIEKNISNSKLTLNIIELGFLSEFYFGVRYPGDSYVQADEDSAETCIRIAKTVKLEIDFFIKNLVGIFEEEKRLVNLDDNLGELINKTSMFTQGEK